MIPKGTDVYKIQGLNLPHFELVRSAKAPIMGLKLKAATVPTIYIMAVASVAFKP